MSEQYKDLGITQSQDGDYWDIVVPDLDFNTAYALQAAWVYVDSEKGTSDLSDRFNFTTPDQEGLLSPQFTSNNLYAENSILYISWNGMDSGGNPYLNSILKQVNIWIKGGDFGDEYVKFGTFGNKAGTITVNATKISTYCVKLQAESKLDKFSGFSSEFCVTMLKQPTPVSNLQGRWVKDDLTSKTDALMITFNFDAAYSDAANSNINADYFLITLAANDKDRTFWFPVNKASITQSFFLSAIDNKTSFGLFASQFEVFILVRDTLGQVSTLVNGQTLTYLTPLDTPIITATAGTLSYSVYYNSQTNKPFDNIYIYEDTGSGYNQVAQGTSNPIVVPVNNTLQRSVKAQFYDSNGGSTSFSGVVTVTPLGVVTVDTEGPNNVASVSVQSGIDTSGYLGFNAYADISWTPVTGGGLRGYRIRFSNDNNTTFSYVDSPGSGTTYRLGGLAIGATYKIAVASYDEYNNTSTSYVSGPDVLVSGTPAITNYITGGPFQFGVGIGVSNTQMTVTNNGTGSYSIDGFSSKTLNLIRGATYTFNINALGHPFWIQTSGNGYNSSNVFSSGVSLTSGARDSGVITFEVPQNAPDTLYYQCEFHPAMYGLINIINSNTGNTGLYFDDSNYWYLNASNSARLKVGGESNNYIEWNGASFVIDGDLRAKKGSFSGNVNIATGASLYSGTLTGNTVTSTGDTGGTLSGAGYVLNSTGIKFNSSSVTDITTIDASTGKLSTSSANIGGWEVNSTTISKNGITLNSSGKIIGNSGAYYIGIEPKSSSVDDIVLWAGQSATGGSAASGANFRVTAGGTLYATGAVIQGDITLTNGSGLSTLIDGKANIYRSNTQPSGTSYNIGDLWVDTDDNNKVYQWSGSEWVVVQDSATALAAASSATDAANTATDAANAATGAASAATDAASAATDAAAIASGKAQKFDQTSGNLVTGLTLSPGSASIYSTKTFYEDSTNGWYLGWKSVGGGSYSPAIAIGGSTTYLKYATDTGLEIKGNIKATTGSFDGNVTAGTVTIGPGGISHNKFSINNDGSASFSGDINGATITGSTITTSENYNSSLRMNSINNQLEWITNGNVIGRAFVYAGNQTILASGAGGDYLTYPTLAGMINLSNESVSMQVTNAAGNSIGGLIVDNTNATFTGVNVMTLKGSSLSTAGVAGSAIGYMRNIGMGTGTKSATDTDGVRGDIWIQYS